MNSRFSVPRALFSALLTMLVLGTGVLPELLDRDAEQRTTIEAPHDASDCPGAHDHRVCTQVHSTSRAIPAGRPVPLPPPAASAWTLAARLGALTPGVVAPDHPIRAPPA